MYKQLLENQWTIKDIDDADYFYLLHLFSEVDSKGNDNERMSAEDFFKSIGQATT